MAATDIKFRNLPLEEKRDIIADLAEVRELTYNGERSQWFDKHSRTFIPNALIQLEDDAEDFELSDGASWHFWRQDGIWFGPFDGEVDCLDSAWESMKAAGFQVVRRVA